MIVGRLSTDPMSLTIDLPEDVVRRLEAAGCGTRRQRRGTGGGNARPAAPVDGEFSETVTATIAEHPEMLDRLALHAPADGFGDQDLHPDVVDRGDPLARSVTLTGLRVRCVPRCRLGRSRGRTRRAFS